VSILVAPDSFKGTYTAAEVAEHIGAGIEAAGVSAIPMPVADGGEGTLECLRLPMHLSIVTANCRNPWGSPMRGRYGLSSDGTAVAAIRASGVVPEKMTVLADVTTLFSDAAEVFAPQKGADPATVERLAARLVDQARRYPRDPRNVRSGGAAGGFAGGMWAVFGAQITAGADFVLDHCAFDEALQQVSAVVVGEGRLDSQTKAGKIISAILRRARPLPVYAVVGSIGDYWGDDFAGVRPASDAVAMRHAASEIASLMRLFAHQ